MPPAHPFDGHVQQLFPVLNDVPQELRAHKVVGIKLDEHRVREERDGAHVRCVLPDRRVPVREAVLLRDTPPETKQRRLPARHGAALQGLPHLVGLLQVEVREDHAHEVAQRPNHREVDRQRLLQLPRPVEVWHAQHDLRETALLHNGTSHLVPGERARGDGLIQHLAPQVWIQS